MNHELNKLVSSLIEAASRPDARHTLKSRILELAKLAQVVPDQQFLLRTVAKSMTSTVDSVFGPVSMILVLTEPGRRQVYFAVLARLAEDGLPDDANAGDIWRRELLERLLLQSDESLIAHTYGHCPAGFVRILRRLGNMARAPRIYATLFKLMSEDPGLASGLLAGDHAPLPDPLIDLLANLPRVPQALSLAKSFGHPVDYSRFMSAYRLLTGERELLADHVTRICAGEAPAALLQGLYHAAPFEAPAISSPGIRHIATGAELVQASLDFHNCLANFVAEAIRGERQYYVWEKQGEPAVVFCICADRPFGWYLNEYRLAHNRRVPEALATELENLLQDLGIRTTGSLESIMCHFVSRPGDEAELDELLENLAA